MIAREFPDIQAIQSNKMEKRSSIFCIYLRNRSEWSQCHIFLLKHHTFICTRHALAARLAESITLSGLSKNFPWIFAIYHRYLAFLKFEDSVVYRFKISGCRSCSFCNSLNRCLSFTFLYLTFIKNYERVSSETTESYMCFAFYCL